MPSSKTMQQFLYSFQHMLSGVHGVITLAVQAKATLVNQGLTYTSVPYGTIGNSTTITLSAGGTAGSELVTVVGRAIDVAIDSGVSTISQVAAALQASTAATALVVVTGTGTAGVNALTTTPLAGGVDGVSSSSIPGAASVVQSAVGEITITLSDLYNAFTFGKAMIVKAAPQDLIPQIVSQDVNGTKQVKIKLLTGATPTDPGAACQLYVMLWMRNSGVSN